MILSERKAKLSSFQLLSRPFPAGADINADGKRDLAVANIGLGNADGASLSVLLGNGDGTF